MKTIQTEQYKDFAKTLQSFFEDYLVRERNVSGNTIRSYRDTFVLLLDFMNDIHQIPADKITFKDFDKNIILEFLDWLQDKRNSSNNTRNQRYAAISSFFRYVMYLDPVHMARWQSICSIRLKRASKKEINFLTVDGMKYLLEQIPKDTLSGRRNLTMLALLYNTGARVQELIDLTPTSIRADKPFVVELLGKGSKKRVVPISDEMMILLKKYMTENGLDKPEKTHYPLFFNHWGEKLTNPGVSYVIRKYAAMARTKYPALIPKDISPHKFRHSRAMHLLQAGVNLVYIRDILGHVSIQTTEIYARTNPEVKAKVLEQAYADVGLSQPQIKSWEQSPKLKSYLKGLG
ncbi:tyrosine-type recombinase/integrase [Bacteroides fragilis]|jgi:site-specific recombinase XerD|nr:tyrosine-type recombinase/integrase [Bacteroides fragilis]MCM0201421.1 tyrosine-type recombinase/integrase [Bacteroides fragilis]MCM0211990.1 tyrosine-type recombinase/integrase [Bacteroides fragilis]MCM0216423.1 tyrosine-type recombinase/integrase [Bacteroides fragilis]MCM0240867.1 tyrosine-type recombinase/integrase [Bacteroides fragilis]